MASVQKDLTIIETTGEIDIPSDQNGGGSLQYLSGAGTVVVEQSCGVDANGTPVWADLPTPVARTTVGITTFEVVGANKIRMRKSVGGAACAAVLTFGRP